MMKHRASINHFRKSAIASAVACAMMSPLALADGAGFDSYTSTSISKEKEVSKHVALRKELETTKRVGYAGDVDISGEMEIKALGLALIDNEQFSVGNQVDNDRNENEATVGAGDEDSSAFQGASGNVGANVAAGSGNQQDNAAALATSDASWVFGGDSNGDAHDPHPNSGVHSDAEVFVDQESAGNSTSNRGTSNNAGLGGSAFEGASGNIGVNSAAGAGNQQKNNLAAAVMNGRAVLTEATVSTLQNSHGNVVSNLPSCDCTPTANSAVIAGNAFQDASGNIGVNVAAGTGNQQSNSLAISGSEM